MSDLSHNVIKKRARLLFWQSAAIGLLVVYMIGSATLLLINGFQGSQTRDTLIDCVETTGECNKRNQKQTAKVVQQLIDANALDEVTTRRIVVITEACGKKPGIEGVQDDTLRIELLQNCVDAQIKTEERVLKND